MRLKAFYYELQQIKATEKFSNDKYVYKDTLYLIKLFFAKFPTVESFIEGYNPDELAVLSIESIKNSMPISSLQLSLLRTEIEGNLFEKLVAKIPGYQLNHLGQLEVKTTTFYAKKLVEGYYRDRSKRYSTIAVTNISQLMCGFFGKNLSINELPPEKFSNKQAYCVLL